MGNTTAYFHAVAGNVAAFIPEDCEYLGSFLCQGRMPAQILSKYKILKKQNPAEGTFIDQMIATFSEASTHPDENDLIDAQNFVGTILNRCGGAL